MEKKENDFCIPTYVINLKERTDRKKHIYDQFHNKPEFDLNFIEAEEHPVGTIGLWKSIVKVIKEAIKNEDDIILLCEDDHTFTSFYSKEYMFSNIFNAYKKDAELLSGGIGGFGVAVPIGPNLYWINWYWSNQFLVIYRPLFKRILEYSFKDTDMSDCVLSALTHKKMTMYPFISVQTDFGYSDVTLPNNRERGLIDAYFIDANSRLSLIHQINHCYNYKGKNEK